MEVLSPTFLNFLFRTSHFPLVSGMGWVSQGPQLLSSRQSCSSLCWNSGDCLEGLLGTPGCVASFKLCICEPSPPWAGGERPWASATLSFNAPTRSGLSRGVLRDAFSPSLGISGPSSSVRPAFATWPGVLCTWGVSLPECTAHSETAKFTGSSRARTPARSCENTKPRHDLWMFHFLWPVTSRPGMPALCLSQHQVTFVTVFSQ